MVAAIVHAQSPVTLLGGADIGNNELNICLTVAPSVVAADGGADHALRLAVQPLAVIGDLDSISIAARHAYGDVLHHIAEQDSTDFDKCLRHIRAPLVIAAGFLGGRLDHTLSALGVLARRDARHVILVTQDDACVLLPQGESHWRFSIGDRAALLPLGPAVVTSRGLQWDVRDAAMAPTGLVSSSNAVVAETLSFQVAGPVLLTVPLTALDAVIDGVAAQRGVSSLAH